jgi:hypothetical protein
MKPSLKRVYWENGSINIYRTPVSVDYMYFPSAFFLLYFIHCTQITWKQLKVPGTTPCAPGPLEVRGKRPKRAEGAEGKEAYTVHTTNIISQQQDVVARGLISVFFISLISFHHQASVIGETHSLVPGTVHVVLKANAGPTLNQLSTHVHKSSTKLSHVQLRYNKW